MALKTFNGVPLAERLKARGLTTSQVHDFARLLDFVNWPHIEVAMTTVLIGVNQGIPYTKWGHIDLIEVHAELVFENGREVDMLFAVRPKGSLEDLPVALNYQRSAFTRCLVEKNHREKYRKVLHTSGGMALLVQEAAEMLAEGAVLLHAKLAETAPTEDHAKTDHAVDAIKYALMNLPKSVNQEERLTDTPAKLRRAVASGKRKLVIVD